MLVVDLMHEFELGVWKAVFRHLIRILYASVPNGSLVMELDRRLVFPHLRHSFRRPTYLLIAFDWSRLLGGRPSVNFQQTHQR
jgi:hypothetical protein